jgi:phage tail-like protein
MDVNGTRFHLLLGADDWAQRATNASGTLPLGSVFAQPDSDVSWDTRRNELTLGARTFAFVPSSGDRAVDVSARRGAAADAFGNIYWIAANGTELLVESSGSRTTSHFWSSLDSCPPKHEGRSFAVFAAQDDTGGSATPLALCGLAVTTQHYLVVGTIEPAGLLVFDLHRGGEPRQLLWPVAFAPFDLCATDDGGVWVLDRDHKRAWRLDRTFGVVALGPAPNSAADETFAAIDGGTTHPKLPVAIALDMSLLLAATDPVAIEVLDDDSILLLDSPSGDAFSRVIRVHKDGTSASASTDIAKSLVEADKQPGFQLLGHDFMLADDVLTIAASDGDQAFAFTLDLEGGGVALHPLPDYFPMRLFAGKALISAGKALISAGQAVIGDTTLYDAQDRWVPLVAQRRNRYAYNATLVIPQLDGKDPDCVWHRLMLDACIPPECDIEVESRAANDPALLDVGEWYREPRRLVRRATGSELAWSTDTRGAGIDTWELLFQQAKGRYLQLRLTLTGNGRSSPRIRALRAWYPRFSYLEHYLPGVYRENDASASFLDRFLANVEGFFTNIEDRIAAAQCLLDVRCAPPETLEWLASWFDVALDPAWDEQKRRLFLRYAAQFFEWRGTVPGLMMALRLVFEDCPNDTIFDVDQSRRVGPRIVEKFRTRSLPGVLFGDTSETDTAGLPLRLVEEKWQPSAGAADLNHRWAEFIGVDGATYDITGSSSDAAQWREFSRATLGFVPAATSADLALWQQVLFRRYKSLDDLNREWQTSYGAWSAIPLFTQLPTRSAPLRDWVLFEGLVLPARVAAHRFSVFLPQGTLGLADREKQLDLARRVIALEKPAHTAFDVKFYWAFFRVGEARLGEDTVVDIGSRSPELLSPFVLDRNYLGSGWLAGRSSLGPSASSDCGCPPPTPGGSR